MLISDGRDGKEKVGVAMAGYGGAAVGFKLGGSGDVTQANRLWHNTDRHPQRIGSGVILGDHVYTPYETAISCTELRTGKEVWRHRVSGNEFWGSIVAAPALGRAYVTSRQGRTIVFAPDPGGFKLLATNDLGEPSNSTPAICDGQIFLRTAGHLWCIEEK